MKIYILILFLFILPLASSAHFIVGYVDDANDGTAANNYRVVVWNPLNGAGDNVTDVIGPNGNSGSDNVFMVDCELLSSPCQVGDVLNYSVFEGPLSLVGTANVTSAGFDVGDRVTLNSPPRFNSIVVDDSFDLVLNEIDLLAANSRDVFCEAVVEELDGEVLDNFYSEFFDSTNSSFGDSDDNNFHYTNSSCFVNSSYGNENETKVSCLYELEYYSNPGNWDCFIRINDSLVMKNASDSTNVNELISLNITSVVNFTSGGAEEVSEEAEIVINNIGNVELDLSLSGYAQTLQDGYSMNCTTGNILIDYQKYSFSSVLGDLDLSAFESSYSNLTSTPIITDLNFSSREDDFTDEAFSSTYWRVYVPSGVSGRCNGNIIFGGVISS